MEEEEKKETAMIRVSKDTNALIDDLVKQVERLGEDKVGELCNFPTGMVGINKGELVKYAAELVNHRIFFEEGSGRPMPALFDTLNEEDKKARCKRAIEYIEECQRILEEGLMIEYKLIRSRIREGVEVMLSEVEQRVNDAMVLSWITTVRNMVGIIEIREDAPKDKYTIEALDNLQKIKDFLSRI